MKAGFSRLDITPPLGVNLSGYFHYRAASDITTPLYVNSVAFCDDEGNTAVIVSIDIIELMMKDTDRIRDHISQKTGVPKDNIALCCTHTHFGPDVSGVFFPVGDAYVEFFTNKLCDSVVLAIADMKDAVGYSAKGKAEGISFIRDFKHKNGDPHDWKAENLIPIGEPDETLGLVKFVREGASDIAIVNFQTHPDVCGEYKFNYDWPGYVREFLENALFDVADGKGVKSICINGAQGDVNHIDIFNKHGGAEHAKHMARVIVGNVLGMYTYAEEIKTDKVFAGYKRIMANAVIPSKEEVELSHHLAKVYGMGTRAERYAYDDYVKDKDLLFKSIATVNRNLVMEGRDPVLPLDVCCIGIGDIALVTFPGEPYTDVGRKTKENSPFKMTMVSCCANGSEAYFVTEGHELGDPKESRDRFERGTAEKLRDAAIELTKELHG